jgi:hypothetical protein
LNSPFVLAGSSRRLHAFMIDLACVSLGALGGAAIGRATSAPNDEQPTACSAALRVLAGFRRAE